MIKNTLISLLILVNFLILPKDITTGFIAFVLFCLGCFIIYKCDKHIYKFYDKMWGDDDVK